MIGSYNEARLDALVSTEHIGIHRKSQAKNNLPYQI